MSSKCPVQEGRCAVFFQMLGVSWTPYLDALYDRCPSHAEAIPYNASATGSAESLEAKLEALPNIHAVEVGSIEPVSRPRSGPQGSKIDNGRARSSTDTLECIDRFGRQASGVAGASSSEGNSPASGTRSPMMRDGGGGGGGKGALLPPALLRARSCPVGTTALVVVVLEVTSIAYLATRRSHPRGLGTSIEIPRLAGACPCPVIGTRKRTVGLAEARLPSMRRFRSSPAWPWLSEGPRFLPPATIRQGVEVELFLRERESAHVDRDLRVAWR